MNGDMSEMEIQIQEEGAKDYAVVFGCLLDTGARKHLPVGPLTLLFSRYYYNVHIYQIERPEGKCGQSQDGTSDYDVLTF